MSLFFHTNKPRQYGNWTFAILLSIFVVISFYKPAVGLAGSGALLILGAIIVEMYSKSIWADYKSSYRPSKDKLRQFWSEPKEIYYKANIYFVWPVVLLFGIMSVAIAYVLG